MGSPNPQQDDQTVFNTSLTTHSLSPLWTVLSKMVPPSPNPLANVTHWPYAAVRPLLIRSGTLISAEEAERRVLMLINSSPRLPGAPYTTDTIYAGLQLILPGETAPAHRHTAFALRFIVEGSSGFTAVEGKKMMMERGDVILTPSWTWHDHGSEGNGPMIWLDGLDLPVYNGLLRVNFAENYEEDRYPSVLLADDEMEGDGTCGGMRVGWKAVAESLDENKEGEGFARYEYRDGNGPGGHLSRTISAQAERVAAGTASPRSRETLSFVYHVYEGEGFSLITTPEGKEERVEWKTRDTFSVPAWSVISHHCTMESGSAYLFAINDRPMIEALGLYRKESL